MTIHDPKIVVLDGLVLNPGDLSWSALEQLGATVIHGRTPEEEVVGRAAGAHIVLTNKTPLGKDVIEALADLRYIGVMATGYDVVDVATAKQNGITVTNVPAYGTASVAQFTFALILELCHHVGLHSIAVRQGEWSKTPNWSFWKKPLTELDGKTLGIIGYGRIGAQTAAIASAFGMPVVVHSRSAPPCGSFRAMDLEGLLATSDIVTLHCPLLPDTRGMINRVRLGRMKRSAFLVNTSRGPLVVDHDLADALNTGGIAGAALDVLSVEPPLDSNPLLSAKNCIVTPHLGWATMEARSRLLQCAVDNVRCFLESRPRNTV